MKKSLGQKIYKKIRDDITYGRLAPGQRFTETELTKKYKVSKSPIREALYQLVTERFVVFEGNKNKKISVAKLSLKEVNELYDIRVLLEGYATRLFAEQATAKQVAYLTDLNEKLRKANETNNPKEWIDKDTLFHEYLVANCGNSNVIPILDVLKRKVYRYKFVVLSVPGHSNEYIKDHEGIIRGCAENDGLLAEKHMKHHLTTVQRILTDFLELLPIPQLK